MAIVPADMPWVQAQTVEAAGPMAIAVLRHQEQNGHPVLDQARRKQAESRTT
ncbi:hypothetical protein P5705_12170 [Pseudomonas entomophila]|uniref:hypothetical protein n=1 Tax=Pseudomonas entomophila TaxID=312306 RepID=UPI0024074106|nr:hypothetical protein [Pseudomonas entomophila]MDF9618404.1 hypothetical protein [Pseudomonas entomophila]